MKTSRKKQATQALPKQDSKTSGNRGIPATFWIQAQDQQRLKEVAIQHNLSVSNVINRAIRRFLADPNPFFRP